MLQYFDTARRASGQRVVAAGAFLETGIHEARKQPPPIITVHRQVSAEITRRPSRYQSLGSHTSHSSLC